MEKICKFCGKKFSAPQFLSKEIKGSCGECTRFCMKECKTASQTTTSWHKGICVECTHNPYMLKHKWNGKRWVLKDGESDG